jgi:alanine racemase
VSRQTQAIIHADAIIQNFKALAALAPHSQSMAVIKADAYGHGAVNVARMLKHVSPRFAVAIIEEAIALRHAGISAPIIVLEGAHQRKECEMAAAHNCILVTHNEQQLSWIKACAVTERPQVWLKVDSGMHRLGFAIDDVEDILHKYKHDGMLNDNTVLVTHLACADDNENSFTQHQIESFTQLAERTRLGVSVANSPAAIQWPESRGCWNRLGVAVYGGFPESPVSLMPAMTLRSSIIALRQVAKGESVGYGQTWTAQQNSTIATVGIGYADGYPRHCPNGTPVAVNGQPASLAGRVSMDMITIDVTHLPDVAVGDSVELWGENVSIGRVAEAAGTIDYELMTRVSARVPRIVKYK